MGEVCVVHDMCVQRSIRQAALRSPVCPSRVRTRKRLSSSSHAKLSSSHAHKPDGAAQRRGPSSKERAHARTAGLEGRDFLESRKGECAVILVEREDVEVEKMRILILDHCVAPHARVESAIARATSASAVSTATDGRRHLRTLQPKPT